jgi:hypothetical protein
VQKLFAAPLLPRGVLERHLIAFCADVGGIVVCSQFWAAYVPCEAQFRDAVQLTLEQIDVIRRLTQKYEPHLTLCLSASGTYIRLFASPHCHPAVYFSHAHSGQYTASGVFAQNLHMCALLRAHSCRYLFLCVQTLAQWVRLDRSGCCAGVRDGVCLSACLPVLHSLFI